MAILQVQNLKKSFGETEVLKDISFSLEKGEVLSIIGSSGSGKTTLLRCLNFLEFAESGTISVNGKEIFRGGVQKRYREKEIRENRLHFGLVFQSFNLFPQYSVLQNVTLAPRLLKRDTPENIEKKALALIDRVGLSDRVDYYPCMLSGGQQQRVAIARALINDPKVLLLDEPLGALDLKLRKDMQNELKKIQQAIGITFIFVTHDQEEALSMSDTVVVMDKGEIQQIGSPIDIYNEPKNAFVADFIGESNILDGTMIEDYLVEVAGQRFKSLDSGFGKMAPVDVVIRPEDIDIVPTGSAAAHINGVVTSVTFKGVHYEIIVDVDGFKWMIQTTDSANVGDKIGLALTPDDIHVMAKSVYSGTMGDYSTFSDEMEEALQEEGSEHED